MQLLLALPLGPLSLQLCFRAPRTRILVGMGRWQLDVLPVMEVLLPLLLVDLQPLELLAFSRTGRRRLQAALLLLHAKLQRILMLLPHHLMLLQRPRSGFVRALHRAREQNGQGRQDQNIELP